MNQDNNELMSMHGFKTTYSKLAPSKSVDIKEPVFKDPHKESMINLKIYNMKRSSKSVFINTGGSILEIS